MMQERTFTFPRHVPPQPYLDALQTSFTVPPTITLMHIDETIRCFWEYDADVPDAATIEAAQRLLDSLVVTSTATEAALDSVASTLVADTATTVVSDARIDALEQHLALAIQQIADLAATLDV